LISWDERSDGSDRYVQQRPQIVATETKDVVTIGKPVCCAQKWGELKPKHNFSRIAIFDEGSMHYPSGALS
jgi:hypothetical protein